MQDRRKKSLFKVFIVISITMVFFVQQLATTTYTVKIPEYYAASKQEQKDFISKMVPYAQDGMKESGVYASLTIAQAILESGWGKDGTPQINNYFGVKRGTSNDVCSNIGGKHQGKGNAVWGGTSVCLKASEGGGAYFRAYNSALESVQDHHRLFWCSSRYEGIITSTTLQEQLRALAYSGYANTGVYPKGKFNEPYYNSLSNIINKYNLTQYDAGISYDGSVPSYATSCTNTGGNPFTGEIQGPIDYTDDSYFNLETEYGGDITKGYLYERFSKEPLWTQFTEEDDDQKVTLILRNIFLQGEQLYGDGELHLKNLVSDGSNVSAPINGIVSPTEAGNFANWKQANWPNIHLGNSSLTIKSSGCLVTSVAIQIARSGTSTIFGNNFDPGTFVSYLNTRGGFQGGDFVWNSPSTSGFAPNFKFVSKKTVTTMDIGGVLVKELERGYYITLRVKYGGGQHWVAVYDASKGKNVSIYDPAGNSNNLWDLYPNHLIWEYALYKVG